MFERIKDILERSDTNERVMPPTELYNEGWLLRAALDWFAEHPAVSHELTVPEGARWYSEALLPSQFLARWRGDPLTETYTHADGAVGQFRIGESGAGDLALDGSAKHFVVLEAKLNSKLSSGIKNAPGYDQAARNVACMGHIIALAGCRPETAETLGFFVVAPASQIERGLFEQQLTKESIEQKVSQRVAAYEDAERKAWFDEWFAPMLERMQVATISWEDVLAAIAAVDEPSGRSFAEFYARCLRYNRLRAK